MNTWLNRQRYLIDFTLAALARRRGRAFGLLAVYAVLVFVLASALLFGHALRLEMRAVLAQAPEVVVQRLEAGRHAPIEPGTLERLGTLRGVQRQQARLWGYYYDSVIKANTTFMVPAEAPQAPPPGQIVIGPAYARARGLAAGDALAFYGAGGQAQRFTIAAVLPQATELMSADLVLLCEADFRAFFGVSAGYATDIALSVANPQEVRTVARKVAAALPGARVVLREELQRTYANVFDWREGMVLVLMSGALLAFAILAWNQAAGMTAQERREIGVLKAVGWSSADVLHMKLWEGLLTSLAAFVIGYVGAYVAVFHFDAALFRPVLQGWAVIYPRFSLPPQLDALQFFTLLLLTVVPFTAATLVPSWRAAITEPDAVLRAA